MDRVNKNVIKVASHGPHGDAFHAIRINELPLCRYRLNELSLETATQRAEHEMKRTYAFRVVIRNQDLRCRVIDVRLHAGHLEHQHLLPHQQGTFRQRTV